MNKYILIVFLIAIAGNALGQSNKSSRATSGDSRSSDNFSQEIQPAEFPGGMRGFSNYLSKKLKMPRDARAQKVRGNVVVQFVIDTVGNVKKETVRVIQSLMESCDKEALRVIMNMPTWTPAVHLVTNKKVETLFNFPIKFYSRQ